jgi:hypothetical protein
MTAATRYGEIPLESGNILRDGHRNICIKFSDESRYVIAYNFSVSGTYSTVSITDNHGQHYDGPYYINGGPTGWSGYHHTTPFPPCEYESMRGTIALQRAQTPPVFGWNCVPTFTPLTTRMIDLVKRGTPAHVAREIGEKEEHTIALEKESKEKEVRISALEARVKELEALIATPKPDTSVVSLLELEDFFGPPSDADIGNLPEFVHDAE